MRNYEGMRLPPAIDPHLRNELLKVDKFLKQLPAALRRSLEQSNNPRAVIDGGPGGGGGGGGGGGMPDHQHSVTGDGGAQLGVHGGLVKYYGQHTFVDPTLPQLQVGDSSTTGSTQLRFYTGAAGTGPGIANVNFGDNAGALGAPVTTADRIGCPGSRLYLWKDLGGTYDAVYGQNATDNWVMPGPEDITYSIFTGGAPPFTAFPRAFWYGNGDYVNYGSISSKKSTGALVPGIPQISLEETLTGTNVIAIRAPAVVSVDQLQRLFDYTGRIPVTGDDPPAVAAGALGKVDDTAKTAAIGSTNLTNGANLGMYVVHYYMECTTSAAGASAVTFQVNYTDSVGATNQTGAATLACTATGHAFGSINFYVASGNISYQTNWVTPSTAVMNLRVRITYLG